MDGQMCEDIRIGVLVRSELYGDKLWHRVRTQNGAPVEHSGVWVAFSSTLLMQAGGIRRFLEEWEQEP